ncbi:NAD-dependent epimerase/dehydratase family protein [Actinospongicola halichondriae]|uniref:NAD-dependent epimerase/dehydratase family protein n=1 Tax=Actinospongicola halichondriae TaxID=3236844 RepID=UPI003D5431FB
MTSGTDGEPTVNRVLVTGGAGFIGSHIVDELLARGSEVVVLDSLAADVHPTRPVLPDGVELIERDIGDPDAWEAALDGVDAVCHQAARVGLGVDFGDVTSYVADNDTGTAVGLSVLHRRGFRGRFVLASSMVVYGEGRYRCDEHGVVRPGARSITSLESGDYEPPCPICGSPLAWELVPEDAPLDPRNVYAATKLHQEHLCTAFEREHDVSVVSLRYHNVYGPRMPRDTPYAGVASIFRSALERGEVPKVFEDGGQQRDFVHVADVARANVAALTTPAVSGAFNVCSGEPHTVLDMAAALSAAFGAAPPEVVGGYRLGDVRHVVASPAKAADELGFRASISFADGMREFATAQLR